jgi:hypothetical protein
MMGDYHVRLCEGLGGGSFFGLLGPTRNEKVEVELIFDSRDGKNRRCIREATELAEVCDTLGIFFSAREFEERLKLRLRSREGFCLASLLLKP